MSNPIKKSELSDMSPSKPLEQATTAENKPSGQKAKPERFYFPAQEKERAMNALYATHQHTGITRWSTYVSAAVAEYTRRLEAQHNRGNPF